MTGLHGITFAAAEPDTGVTYAVHLNGVTPYDTNPIPTALLTNADSFLALRFLRSRLVAEMSENFLFRCHPNRVVAGSTG